MDRIKKQKMRWRSKRSLLELDLLFERFIVSGKFDKLSDQELNNYDELLEMEDSDILLLLQGSATLPDTKIQNLVDQIRKTN